MEDILPPPPPPPTPCPLPLFCNTLEVFGYMFEHENSACLFAVAMAYHRYLPAQEHFALQDGNVYLFYTIESVQSS